jgi:methyl-accepting chemotaxis protein
MTPDWNAVRLDLLQIDEAMRASLREMRPFFARVLPGILARFYDKVRHTDPASGVFKDGVMQESIRLQLQHWELIASGHFGADYQASAVRFCELNHRAGVAPQWYVGCRLMFIAEQLMRAVEGEVVMPRFGKAAQAARDRKAAMLNAIAKANMMDTETIVATYFGSNRQLRKDAIAEASNRFRAIITSLSQASSELEGTARALSDNAGNTTRLATVVANASEDASNNVQSVASATEELAISVREISQQVQESNRIAASAVSQADETDSRINALSQAANRIGDVIKLITSVAEQTNLLALNATIEAARAGDMGKGFAVVASEVKALANQTSSATDQISHQISAIQDASRRTAQEISSIARSINELTDAAMKIDAAVEEQSVTTQQIASSMQVAAANTGRATKDVASVEQASSGNLDAVRNLIGWAQRLSATAQDVERQVADFFDRVRAA